MSDWYFLRDGGQFGPMPWEEIWRRGQTGELRPSDLVWKDGMPEWRVAASVPNLFPAAQPAPAPQRPAYSPAPQAAPQPQVMPQPQAAPYAQGAPRPTGDEQFMRWLLPVGRSPWAIAAGYLGLLSFLGIFAPFALATGILAVVDIKKNPQKHGMGRAIFGIVMGVIFSVILVIGVAWGMGAD